MESPIPITPQPKISYHRHSTIWYFILYSIFPLIPMLFNFVHFLFLFIRH